MAYNYKPSYLEPREPNFHNRKCPQQIDLDKMLEECDETQISEKSTSSAGSTLPLPCDGNESISVYLRLRPNDKNLINYRVENNILIASHELDNTCKNKDLTEKHFTFTRIFDKRVSQANLYNDCIYTSINNDNNTTILAYGTSGSGKTFTLLGNMSFPGIVPRTLSQIFIEYADNISQQPVVKCDKGNLEFLDDEHIKQEELLRKSILANFNKEYYKTMHNHIKEDNLFKNKHLTDMTVYIWISFAEIYNENVYDLLDPMYDKENHKNRRRLRVISNDGRAYVKDLTSIFVKNCEEAYELLYYGINQITYASTFINSCSSRSHCIFFIDVITFSPPEQISFISYKLCDLAGSERLKKTINSDLRLKEAQQINTSLMVLGRCLKAVHNQQNKNIIPVIPYRESKLTSIIQGALLGREKLTLIVNLLPDLEYFEENLNVLNFASIAKQIVQRPSNKKNHVTRYSLFFAQAANISPRKSNNNMSELIAENVNLKLEVEQLQDELIHTKQEMLTQESLIRKTLVDNFSDKYQRINDLWGDRLANREKALQVEIEKWKNRYNELLQDYEDLEEEIKSKNEVRYVDSD